MVLFIVLQCLGTNVDRMLSNAIFFIDFTVVHVKILTEAINEFSLDTNYRVTVIHSFKMTTTLPTLRSVRILNNLCHCPLLLPGKEYLLMGQLTMRAGLTKATAEISRDSYVEEWRESMVRRVPNLKKRCPLITTQMTTLVPTTPKSIEGMWNDVDISSNHAFPSCGKEMFKYPREVSRNEDK